MNIKYNQLCIRNAEKKDCEQLAVWWNDGTVMAHAGFPNGLGTSAAEIEKQIADDSDETRRRLIIEYNDVRIGEMSFYVFENHRYEIGIKICESDYQEKGIGRVVLSMLIEELFRMGANVIFLDTNLKNTRAQHVYEKLGFRKTAVHYNSWKTHPPSAHSRQKIPFPPADFSRNCNGLRFCGSRVFRRHAVLLCF